MLLAALITFALAACVTGMLGLGAAMVYKGFLRGTLIDGHLHCGRCGYDMVGHQHRPVRCPECGSDLRVPGMVRIGARRPHKRRIGLGLALIALNVGGLIGCRKLGEMQPTSSSLAAAPGLGPRRRMVSLVTTIDRLADPYSGPDEQTVPEPSAPDSNNAARRSTRVELILADTTIQLPPRHRESVQPVTLTMWGFDQRVWPSLPGFRDQVMHVIPPASPNDERFLEPGILRSWLVSPVLGTPDDPLASTPCRSDRVSGRAQRCVARADNLARAAVNNKNDLDRRSSFASPPWRVGRPGARRSGRAVSVARAGEPALRANDR